MTFQQLNYLLEVERVGSITQAAENLYVTQSSMSAAINALEKELGFAVFNRGRNGVTPTVRGERVLAEAAQILNSYHNMTHADRIGSRRYHIGATSYEPFEKAFCTLVKEHGQEGIFCLEASGGMKAAKQLANQTLDVAILLAHTTKSGAVANLFRERDMQVESLGRVPVMIHIGPGHPLYDAPEVTPKDMERDVLVDWPHTPMLNNSYLRSVFTFDRRRVLLTTSLSARYRLLEQGSAYAVGAPLPEYVMEHYRLRSIPVSDVDYTVLLATNPAREPDHVIERYIQLIREVIA